MASVTEPTPEAIANALRVLGLATDADWARIRRTYRDLVRATHPDIDGTDPGDATRRTAALNVAFDTLATATGAGARPLPVPEPPDPNPLPPSPRITLRAAPGDVFVQLLDAAHAIGEVSYIDPEAGLIQVLLGGGPAASQLLIAVDEDAAPPTASFTLDTPDGDSPPSIRAIVGDLAAAMQPGPLTGSGP